MTGNPFLRYITAALAIGAITVLASAADPKVLVGHTDPVYAAVYTPDGTKLITASFDKTLRLWDLNSLTTLRTMPGHTGLVLCAAISKDGQRIVSGSHDNSLRLWDVPQSAPAAHWQAHAGATSVAVSADGTWVLTGGADKTIKLWNAADRSLIREIGGLPQPIVRVALRSDKQQLTVADAAGFVRFFNPNDGSPQGVIGAHTAEITGLGYPPNNSFLLTSAADGLVKRWPVQLPTTRTAVGHEGALTALKVAPNNSLVVTAALDKTVRVWGFGDARQQRTLDGHSGNVTALAWSADSARVLTGGDDKVPRQFNVGDGTLFKAYPESPAAITSVTIHPNLQELAVGDADRCHQGLSLQ